MKDTPQLGSGNAERRSRPADRETERRLRAIIDQVADGIVIIDDGGVIRFLNSAAQTLFGRPAEALLGSEFGFPVMAQASTEIEVLRPAAQAVVAELRAVPIEWEDEPGLLISLRDVTDRRRAEEQARDLVREQAARAAAEAEEARYRRLAAEKAAIAEENRVLYQRAQEASRAKSEFLAVVSHELRTPLNAIIGYTDLLLMEVGEPITDDQRRKLERVAASSRHLREMVDDILTFSRLEAGREEIKLETVEYGQVAQDAVALVQPMADEKGIAVEVQAPARPCSGETDARKVRQILLNLLSNAVKFTERGTVNIEAIADGDAIVFQVRDSGVGIPASQIDRIWEPFSQGEDSHTRTHGGAGLGLSVVRRLSRMMGGEVSAESVPGEGSTFTVRLPRRVQATS